MPFVYLHVVWFVLWIAFGVEPFPFGLLTMIVSLEAIFLSSFVMISQNRADAKREALAEHQWQLVQAEEKQNEELLEVSRQILELTTEIHRMSTANPATAPIRTNGRQALGPLGANDLRAAPFGSPSEGGTWVARTMRPASRSSTQTDPFFHPRSAPTFRSWAS